MPLRSTTNPARRARFRRLLANHLQGQIELRNALVQLRDRDVEIWEPLRSDHR